ncbi:hypothetical protein E2C01_058713 [Portunus trituberculatus]|uniref:Uncharacterized protein n=1 Tax=Portunus trituberculatus TaxID=210409 RepID=A0A5B7H4X4_PORTR|nr:hypothetical protein [Portunus trituberculatus]
MLCGGFRGRCARQEGLALVPTLARQADTLASSLVSVGLLLKYGEPVFPPFEFQFAYINWFSPTLLK